MTPEHAMGAHSAGTALVAVMREGVKIGMESHVSDLSRLTDAGNGAPLIQFRCI
jgi:hypothetical protein